MLTDIEALLRDGTIPRFILMLIITGTLMFMFARGLAVPEQLFDAALVIIGFYFGATNKPNGSNTAK